MSAVAAGPAFYQTPSSVVIKKKEEQAIAAEKENAAKRFERYKSAWNIAFQAACTLRFFSVDGTDDVQGLCKEHSDQFLKSVRPLSAHGDYPAFDRPADKAAQVKNKVAPKIVEIVALLRPAKDNQTNASTYLPAHYNQWHGKAIELIEILEEVRPVTGCCDGVCTIL